MTNTQETMNELGQQAVAASRVMAKAKSQIKNQALHAIADNLLAQQATIIKANEQDLLAGKEKGLDEALLDRLALDESRIAAMAGGLRQIADLPDPVGEISDLKYRPSGIQLGKMRVPLGVVGMIYESRPNVTADAAALCLKSGNAVILRGGSEAKNSNQSIAQCIKQSLAQVGLPEHAVQVVKTTDRAAVNHLITMTDFVDVIIPRGGKGLVSLISEQAKVPVIKHLDGICHVYIDDKADRTKAFNIALNSKTHRYGVCNAMETLLVAKNAAADILPKLAKAYLEKGVELRGCVQTCELIKEAIAASEEDWDTEYLAPILAIKIVEDMAEAMEHIARHSSGHTEAIVTEDYTSARVFMAQVDSSSVIINASTRFADGFEYGLGAEIGISTDKIHVRGPVGLEGLTSQKYVVFGDGQIRT